MSRHETIQFPQTTGNRDGHQQHEEIPLHRLTSQEERSHRDHLNEIFKMFDRDNDGYLSLREMKDLIKRHQCNQIPKGVARQILEAHDVNGDGRLDFEEFYQMSKANDWLFKNFLVRYCKMFIPSPHRVHGDEVDSVQMSTFRSTSVDETDGAYERSMTFCPPPLTMIIFSILEIIMFIIDIIYFKDDPNNNKQIGVNTNGPAATLFIYNPFRRFEAWRFVTYMFVHVGVMHIVMNLIIQIFLGVALELVHCWWRVSLVYIAGVAAGSMGTSLASPKIFLAGASGGVYALITAHIATIIMNWKEMEYAIVQLFVFLIFCMTDIGFSIHRHLTDVNDQVGYVAHLSGAIAGLLVGIGVLRNLKVRPWERKLWWAAVTIYAALMISGIAVHIFYPQHFPQQQRRGLYD